jgi:Recombination endonuclease VII
LCIDHDHQRKTIRGLLCNACNTAIGLFEEDLDRFEAAAIYLRSSAAF